MANELSDSSNTDRKASYTLQQKNCTDIEKLYFWTENLGKTKILAKMVSGICLMMETAAALFLFWFLLVFYQRKQLSGWS